MILRNIFFAIVLLSPFSAFADYVAFQNTYGNPAPLDGTNVTMLGGSAGNRFDFSYLATTTVTLFDRIDFALCRLGGTSAGSLNLEVRYNSTSSAILASSTVVSAGNVISDGTCANGLTNNATTTTFVLNNRLQWVSGVTVYFTVTLSGTAGTYYFTGVNKATYSGNTNYTWYIDNVEMYPTGLSKSYGFIAKGYGGGSSPANQGRGLIYSGTSTTGVVFVECTTWEFDCYIINALSWAFILDTGTLQSDFAVFRSDALSRFPLGYVNDFFTILATTTESSLLLVNMTVPPGLPGHGATLTLDAAHVLDFIYEATTTDKFNTVGAVSEQTFLEITEGYWLYFLYLCTAFYIIRRIMGAHVIPDFMHMNIDTQNFEGKVRGSVSSDAYRYKEKLYQMSKRK